MNDILLVDDQPPLASHHRRLFGERADVIADYDGVVQAIDHGSTWTVAFVDFDLSGASAEPGRTGLSVLHLLKERRPETQRVVYTTLSDNGRTLFAVAAYHWLGAKIILDKSSGDEGIVMAAADQLGPNPTPRAWREKLRDAGLIDHLFSSEQWSPMWKIWPYYNGSIQAVGGHLPAEITRSAVRNFQDRAPLAVSAYLEAFHGKPALTEDRKNSRRTTPLVAFADANSKFFGAADLGEVLGHVRPWERTSQHAK